MKKRKGYLRFELWRVNFDLRNLHNQSYHLQNILIRVTHKNSNSKLEWNCFLCLL
jgi:hypothetical protein